MIRPLMGMVSELQRRQQEMVQLLQRKDREIDDYKAQGSKVTRSKQIASKLNCLFSQSFKFS